MVRALTYILTCGGSGLKQLTETAVLNANYIRVRLQEYFHLPYPTPSMHEAVFSDKTLEPFGVKTLDVAKQLIDEGLPSADDLLPFDCPGCHDDRAHRKREQVGT